MLPERGLKLAQGRPHMTAGCQRWGSSPEVIIHRHNHVSPVAIRLILNRDDVVFNRDRSWTSRAGGNQERKRQRGLQVSDHRAMIAPCALRAGSRLCW